MYFEAPTSRSPWLYVPMIVGGMGMAGLARIVWARRRTLLSPDDPLLRQVVLMVLATLIVIVPFLGVDVMRRVDGLGFMVNGGRYLLPAYGAVAVLLVLGVRGLVGERLLTPALVGVSAIATLFSLRVYDFHYVNRYYGYEDPAELLRRLSFDRPEIVTPATIAIVMVLAGAAAVGAWLLALAGRDGEPAERR